MALECYAGMEEGDLTRILSFMVFLVLFSTEPGTARVDCGQLHGEGNATSEGLVVLCASVSARTQPHNH